MPDELHSLSLEATLDFARAAEHAGFDSLWKQEASGSNAFMVLAAAAMVTDDIALGTGVANVYSRSPALLGMSVATLDRISGGRARLGLGVSSKPMVQRWHGSIFDRPLRRMREAIEIIQLVVSGGRIEYHGEIFSLGPYSSGIAAMDGTVPIYNAAMGETNRRLTAEFADGWMPVMTPVSLLGELIGEIHGLARDAGRDPPTIAPWIPVGVADTTEHAERLVRGHLAQEMAMGYNRLAHEFGYGASADEAHDRWHAGDRAGAAAAISDQLLDELAVYGSANECAERLESYRDAGADHVIVWPSFTSGTEDIRTLVNALGNLSS